ncbi:MAG TPA: tRNA lysidine(34) synthetase TilS [Polyangiaceae bacterium]
MARSHPPSLTTVVRRTLLEECGELRGRVVLAAVSGGGDSQAMLSVLARLAPQLGFELRAHGVDHGLRSAAAGELELARGLAERLGVPFACTKVSLAPGGNLQARARDARYRALRAAAAAEGEGVLIATAHHADDRAETLLLRLLRGAGPRGLAVMPARAQDVIRPLLRAGKSDVLLHLQRHQLDFARDPSNTDAAFLRVRVRHELLPLLSTLSPQIVRHLNALADALGGSTLPEVGELGEVGASRLSVENTAPQLNRAQIREVLRARQLGRPVTIRVAGARDLLVAYGKKTRQS